MKQVILSVVVASGFVALAQTPAAPTQTPVAPTPTPAASTQTPTVAAQASGGDAETQATMTLAEARSRIDSVVNARSGAPMLAIMKQLSAADQKQFLADVNKAIGELPASTEEKAAKYLNVNHAAVKAAAGKGNLLPIIAEVYATVPPEALTIISERFAVDLFNRDGNSGVTYTDAQFTEIALAVVKAVNDRVSDSDNASVRSTFAILMMVRAANITNPEAQEAMINALVETLPSEEARDLAKTEWIPSALGTDGREQGYEPMLASADAGRRPDFKFVLVIAGPQYLESILEDLTGKNMDSMSFMQTRTPVLDAVQNPLIQQVPTLGGNVGGGGGGGDTPTPPPDEPRPLPPQPEPPEPGPY